MGVLEMILWLLGGLGAIILLCVGVLWLERKFPGVHYDERQQAARGKAYRLGFFVGMLWMFVCILYLNFGGNKDNMLLVLWFGFFAQAMVFHVYCLLTHAALPLSQKPMVTIVGYGFLSLVYGGGSAMGWQLDARWPDKPPVTTWLQLSLAVWFGASCIMHLIQYLRDKRE